jgi:hypothetical protein
MRARLTIFDLLVCPSLFKPVFALERNRRIPFLSKLAKHRSTREPSTPCSSTI